MTGALVVRRPGSLTTIQDLGRRGYAHLAVPRSGALDPAAMRLANRLVGNAEDAAVLETTIDGVAFELDGDRAVAVTGAPAPVQIGDRRATWGMPGLARAGELVDVGTVSSGVRSYVAIAGGIAVEPVMGSRSTDLLSGIGPPPLGLGARLELGAVGGPPASVDFVPYPPTPSELHLDCSLGPRDDWLSEPAIAALASATWTVAPESNRIGLRLAGPPLRRRRTGELPSEGIVLGALQLPGDGQPVLFLADHPTTGGYPVVGVVPEPDVWSCAQAVPGATIVLRLKRPRVRIHRT